MHFCSIQEAWGSSSTNNKKMVEKFKPDVFDLDLVKNSRENNNINNSNINNKISCEDVLNHISNCPNCSRKIKKQLYGNFYNNIRDSINEYREPMILVLITVFIILAINLIIKMD